MKPAIELIGIDNCSSCFGCYNVCIKDAIEMKFSKKGFFYPWVDKNRCINCNLCSNICPNLNHKDSNRHEGNLKVYASYTLNESIRKISSSGGLSTEISRYVLESNGVIFGASWNNQFLVEHIEIRNKKNLFKIVGSKYIQSNIDKTYKRILEIIENEKVPVLFFGLPCQIAVIKNIVKSELLITVDLLCHGVPSTTVFEKYLKYISKGNSILDFNFRNKDLGWINSQVKLDCTNGTTYTEFKTKDPFFNGFICDLYVNKSCYNCKFSKLPRKGDITIGDFWKAPKNIMDDKGISLVLSNNPKGDCILEYLERKNRIKLMKSSLKEALIGNPRISNGKLKIRKHREDFFNELSSKNFEYLKEKYINVLKRNVYDEE